MKLLKSLAIGLAATAAGLSSAAAQMNYEGETVTVIINYGAGGSTDVEGRIVAKHLGDHLPGNPDVVIQNMPGGGGNIGSNFLGQAADADGTTLGFFTWNPIDQIIDAPGLMVKYDDFKFIAGLSQPAIYYMRKDVPPGIETPTDLLKAEGFKAGTLSPTIHQTVRTRLALDILDIDYDLVSGYRSLKNVDTAMLQDEIQLSNGSIAGFSSSVVPTLIEPGVALALFHFDVEEDGTFKANPMLADFSDTTFLDLYRAKNGEDAMPSGDEWEALRLINSILNAMYRSVFMPPETPDEAVEAMRAAFEALSQDEEFIAEYKKVTGIEPHMTVGEPGQAIISQLGELEPEFVEQFTAYVNQ